MPEPADIRTASRFWTAFGISLGVPAVGLFLLFAQCRSSAHSYAVACAVAWARLAPFPANVKAPGLGTEGSMLTRRIRVKFRADRRTIEGWLSRSPGTATAKMRRLAPGVRKYAISPGLAATHAEVIVDERKGLVRLYTTWE
jgi:hypothetical protein